MKQFILIMILFCSFKGLTQTYTITTTTKSYYISEYIIDENFISTVTIALHDKDSIIMNGDYKSCFRYLLDNIETDYFIIESTSDVNLYYVYKKNNKYSVMTINKLNDVIDDDFKQIENLRFKQLLDIIL